MAPGIPPCPHAHVAAGAAPAYDAWRPFHAVKVRDCLPRSTLTSQRYTNAFVIDPRGNKVLLGWKKRGFGHGMYNGFGGKVDPDESVESAALRELEEEANISAPLEPCGLLFFVGQGHAHAHHITVFRATSWLRDPTESDEMRPEWFAFPPALAPNTATAPLDLPPFPYHLMWKDDPLWIPLLLTGKYFIARVDYGPVPVPPPTDTPQLLEQGAGYTLNGTFVESGMQRWWVATVDEHEWKLRRIWEI